MQKSIAEWALGKKINYLYVLVEAAVVPSIAGISLSFILHYMNSLEFVSKSLPTIIAFSILPYYFILADVRKSEQKEQTKNDKN